MEWVLRSPQVHSTFGSLGHMAADGYHINEKCNVGLENILDHLLSEDKYLRVYRRNMSFGQNVQKDLMPLIIQVKDEKTTGLLIKILLNLTIPIECLFSVDVVSKTDFGQHTIFELKNLLNATKLGFVDPRVTKVVIDFLRKNIENEQRSNLPLEKCEHIHDCLTLLRNILHIPEDQNFIQHNSSVQNQILWNMFSQGLDKLIIKLTTIPEASNWAVTMVQLIALLYKDQHVGKLHKLLKLWLEDSLSESSEDNESNTSPQNRGSQVSSPMLTTDQTNSDSSDNSMKSEADSGHRGDEIDTDFNKEDVSGHTSPGSIEELDIELAENSPEDLKNTDGILNYTEHNDEIKRKDSDPIQSVSLESDSQTFYAKSIAQSHTNIAKRDNISTKRTIGERDDDYCKDIENMNIINAIKCSPPPTKIRKKQLEIPDFDTLISDCGYATQLENRESISTSSNDDDLKMEKPVHQKPHNPKMKANTKARMNNSNEDKRRKKLVKRISRTSNILHFKGILHHKPTDDDISIVLKEFTVDFLLKGYRFLVKTLHEQTLNHMEVEIDRSHFFWLITYFLKFATQMELDLEHVDSILSFDVISYLTAEGANLCEQFELAVTCNGNDLEPSMRRLHLVVTAIREFVQAVEVYIRITCVSNKDQATILDLQLKMWETGELRSLMVLLIRTYNPSHHSKQYLQDIVVTNHILLLFLDNVLKLPEYTGKLTMIDHIRQFTSSHVMHTYGLLLEDYDSNGEFVNDCVFTVMHHVAGDVGCLTSLYQPNILRAFSYIKKSEYEICDHWTDLVEYVINSFSRRGHEFDFKTGSFKDDADFDIVFAKPMPPAQFKFGISPIDRPESPDTGIDDGWSEEESSTLGWKYVISNTSTNIIREIQRNYKEEGIFKTRISLIKELYKQNLIENGQYDDLVDANEEGDCPDSVEAMRGTDIRRLCEQLVHEGKGGLLEWVQGVLLDVCYVKICLVKEALKNLKRGSGTSKRNSKGDGANATPLWRELNHVMSPVAYHRIRLNTAIPLVPWNCEQSAICKDLKFMQFLNNLGFQMPMDSGKLYIRIPHVWSADILYEVAAKVSNVDPAKLKFSMSDISEESFRNYTPYTTEPTPETSRKMPILPIPENCYRIQRFKQTGAMVQFTPMPRPSVKVDGSFPDSVYNKVNWLELVQKAHMNYRHIPERASSTSVPAEPSFEKNLLKSEKAVSEAPEKTLKDPSPMAGRTPAKRRIESDTVLVPSLSEEVDSECETASVASDFSRMYVSDEEGKPTSW